MDQSRKSNGPMICWWDEAAHLGIYLTPDGTFGTYSRPYGRVMGQSPMDTAWQMQEIEVCHGMNWDWVNMEYDLPPAEDTTNNFPKSENRPKPIEPRPTIQSMQEYLVSFDDD